jgi:hypothetical protein
MSPGIIEDRDDHDVSSHEETTQRRYPEPLELSGALDHFKHEETTPIIGREFIDVNIVNDLLNAENADERLRDLAITSMLYFEREPVVDLLTKNHPSITAWCGLLPCTRQPHRRPSERLRSQAWSAERET